MASSCRVLPQGHPVSLSRISWEEPEIPAQTAQLCEPIPDPDTSPAGDWRSRAEEALQRVKEMEARHAAELVRVAAAEFARGEAKGKAEGEAEVRPLLERLAQSISEISGLRSELRFQAQEDLVQLAINIARRIVHRELETDPEAISGVAKAALERLQLRDLHRVRVHPEHVSMIRALLQKSGAGSRVQVDGDSILQQGDLLFETERATLDASVEAQFREIERGFADRLASESR